MSDHDPNLDAQDRLDTRRAVIISLVACVAVLLASVLIVIAELSR